MKKIILLIALIFIASGLNAQKLTEMNVSKLPKATTDYIKENLPGAKIVRAVKADDKGVITYNVGIDIKGRKHMLVFDKDGKFLKKGDDLVKSDVAKPKTSPAPAKPATPPPSDTKK